MGYLICGFFVNYKECESFEKYLRDLITESIRRGEYEGYNDICRKNKLGNGYISKLIGGKQRPAIKHMLILSKALTGDMHLLHRAWLYFNDRELYDLLEKEAEENITKLIAQQFPDMDEEKVKEVKKELRKLQM